jgi:hypothetical protein
MSERKSGLEEKDWRREDRGELEKQFDCGGGKWRCSNCRLRRS